MNTINWNEISWKELKKRLSDDPEYKANLEIARRVVNNYESVVNYYLGELSSGIIKKVNQIMKRDAYAEYYMFLSHPFNMEVQSAEWHRVSLYKALNDCKLVTYTSNISCRYFYKIARNERKTIDNSYELLEYKDYEALLLCDKTDDEDDNNSLRWMKKAFRELPERDQLVLRYLVVEKLPSIEAYERLECLIHPIAKDGMTSDEVKASWSVKRRQDAISLMKGYALDKLLKKYNEQKNKV